MHVPSVCIADPEEQVQVEAEVRMAPGVQERHWLAEEPEQVRHEKWQGAKEHWPEGSMTCGERQEQVPEVRRAEVDLHVRHWVEAVPEQVAQVEWQGMHVVEVGVENTAPAGHTQRESEARSSPGLQVRHWVGAEPEHMRQRESQERQDEVEGSKKSPVGHTHRPETRERPTLQAVQASMLGVEQVAHVGWQETDLH